MGYFSSLADEVLIYLRKLHPYLLSHHPMCSVYRDDMIYFRGRWYCRGCAVAYPLAASLLLGSIVGLINMPAIDWHWYFGLGLLFGFPQIFRDSIHRAGTAVKTLEKVVLGVAMFLFAWSVNTMPLSLIGRILVFYILALAYGILGGWLRIKYMKKICSSCHFGGDWERCYGFRSVNIYNGREPSLVRKDLELKP